MYNAVRSHIKFTLLTHLIGGVIFPTYIHEKMFELFYRSIFPSMNVFHFTGDKIKEASFICDGLTPALELGVVKTVSNETS